MNRLAQQSSPYLLQHQENPVDWYPWGSEALGRARTEDKPIFLSIGYSACHWCHVMEHESFENQHIAALLNQHFVCIKVDREERPDIDHIYMQAVQMITGRGGWPLSVFLTPELRPFYGGTYWPPEARMGMPGFDQVIVAVIDTWTHRRGMAIKQAAQLTAAMEDNAPSAQGPSDVTSSPLSTDLLETATDRLAASFDKVHGGFGRAPKFPRSMDLQVLLRSWHRNRKPETLNMVVLTLDKMAGGGMYDHLAGGFARYSVDERWLVPHFEKMLYDNALLADLYLDGYLATGNAAYARVASDTMDYVLRDMLDRNGGFHSTEDADSEGEEGKYYVWTVEEVTQILGDARGARFCHVYNVTPYGNFEGKNILHLPRTMTQYAQELSVDMESLAVELAESRTCLRVEREKRTRPGKDDKVLVSWNALMIHTLARGAGILDRADYLSAAQNATRFLLADLRRTDGRLMHCWRHGHAKLDAYLDDYACLINALVTLYETDFDEHWIDTAIELGDIVMQHFRDTQRDGFYFTADDHEALIHRTKELFDGSVPSSSAMAATALIRLGKVCGRQDLVDAAHATVTSVLEAMNRAPEAFGQMLLAADLLIGPTREIALIGDPAGEATAEVLRTLRQTYFPRYVLACRTPGDSSFQSRALEPLFAGKSAAECQPTVFICEDFSCRQPVQGKTDILEAWIALAGDGD